MNFYTNYRVTDYKLVTNVINQDSGNSIALVVYPSPSTSPSASYTNARAYPQARSCLINPIGSGTNNRSITVKGSTLGLYSTYQGAVVPRYAFEALTAYNTNPSYELFFILSVFRPDESTGLINVSIRFEIEFESKLGGRKLLSES